VLNVEVDVDRLLSMFKKVDVDQECGSQYCRLLLGRGHGGEDNFKLSSIHATIGHQRTSDLINRSNPASCRIGDGELNTAPAAVTL